VISAYDRPSLTFPSHRGSIVVRGVEAFAEDGWGHVLIGDVSLRVVKPCARCKIPNIEQVRLGIVRHLTGARDIERMSLCRTLVWSPTSRGRP
jgi:uncharacterized protein YcbX